MTKVPLPNDEINPTAPTAGNAAPMAPPPASNAQPNYASWIERLPRLRIIQPSTRWASITARSAEELLDGALRAASRGYHVIPLAPALAGGDGGKIPLLKGGAHAATDDQLQLLAWWSTYPLANIGVAAGPQSNLFVVDLDQKDGKPGWESLATLEGRYGPLPAGPRVRTPTGGMHFYFLFDPRMRNAVDALPGIDVRAAGGYVVGPSCPCGESWKPLLSAPMAQFAWSAATTSQRVSTSGRRPSFRLSQSQPLMRLGWLRWNC
jgi:putative DNA primase/helicase